MKAQIPFASSKMSWFAVGLVVLQLIIKLTIELGPALEMSNVGVVAATVVFTIGWVVSVALCLAGFRWGYWLGAVWGLLHFVTAGLFPSTGVLAVIVMLDGILIATMCLAILLIDARRRGTASYPSMSKSALGGFSLLLVSILVRTLWITFREPSGAALALNALTGQGGFAERAANALSPIVILSMLVLCVIIPGVIARKRWAFAAAAIFGGLHAALTLVNVIFHINQGGGPAIVIPASLGMLIGGIWVLRLAHAIH